MNEEDRSYWERHAKNYQRSMAVLGRPIPRMVELASEAVRGAETVLEVAAGTGLVTVGIAATAARVVATDYAVAMVETLAARVRAAGLKNVECEQADLYALPYGEDTFDAVVAANVLHLVPDVVGALASLRRVLKPGGRLVLPTFCHDQTPFSWAVSRALALSGFPGHRRFTLKSLRRTLEDTGLQLTRIEALPGLIPIGYVEGSFRSGPTAAGHDEKAGHTPGGPRL